MEKGYVYIGRLVDHNGNFVTSYYKLGKSIDFKARETNLNSTHMPLDVQFVRVFDTEHMSNLEKVLHACFDEYRVVKEYGWRRNITTEWFDVSDEELLTNKIDVVTKYFPNTTEIDLISKIQSDSGTTENQKVELINVVRKSKSKSTFELEINGEDYTGDTAKETFTNAVKYIGRKVGWEIVDQDEDIVTNDMDEYRKKYKNFESIWCTEVDGYYIMTSWGNDYKESLINRMAERYGLNEIKCKYTRIS